MKHIKEYQDYDFIGQQAALHGMTREEWVAHFASPTIGSGIDESKFVMTYEKYIGYGDFKNKWGSPDDIQQDLNLVISRLIAYGGIENHIKHISYDDQSSDKGIKWEITLDGKGSDVIHAYKTSTFRGQYELYLNKKKSNEYEIQQYLLNKYLSDLDRYIAGAKSFDSTYMYSDDNRAYQSGSAHAAELRSLYSKLSSSDKKKAHQAFIDYTKKNVDFKSFTGA
jgi:hypothetical protein